MIAADTLRVPGPSDPARSSYKEWLHLILVEHDEDLIGLLNVSIHGPPEGGTTQVVAAALFDAAGQEWIGNVVPGAWNEASITLSGISTASVSLAFGPDDRLLAAVTMD